MYQRLLSEKLNGLKATGQYRTFVTLNRICGQYAFNIPWEMKAFDGMELAIGLNARLAEYHVELTL
ncbi:hypothetical protein [Diaphorobacter aerolatus]|uniref:Uncharacterized protein n=1 Tax=Diaphorobacter aerolatus TaxID=1288495 RepID=A0A7H0GQX1_9BURK|nr:hypothetical protein [Diaphorobacter aerolatus]QNP50687.1 hypothetical protein H9K75_23125 [Diaphorobacter aerolatus]